MKESILSIIIPTYNRPQQVKAQVKSLLPQLSQEVKLIIRDNCSPTPVKLLFSSEELDKIAICRNDVNIGGDANIARCIELCETEWCWILGDDDFVAPDAINEVLKVIDKYSDAVWFNFDSGEDRKIANSYEFYKNLSSAKEIGNSFWISKCIYNANKLKPYMIDYYANLSSMIGQLALLVAYSNKNYFLGYRFSTNLFLYHSPAEWSNEKFVYMTDIFIKYFKHQKIKGFNFILKGLTEHRLNVIDKNCNNIFLLFFNVINNFGIINSITTLPRSCIKCLYKLMLPKGIVAIKHFFILRYYKIFKPCS